MAATVIQMSSLCPFFFLPLDIKKKKRGQLVPSLLDAVPRLYSRQCVHTCVYTKCSCTLYIVVLPHTGHDFERFVFVKCSCTLRIQTSQCHAQCKVRPQCSIALMLPSFLYRIQKSIFFFSMTKSLYIFQHIWPKSQVSIVHSLELQKTFPSQKM